MNTNSLRYTILTALICAISYGQEERNSLGDGSDIADLIKNASEQPVASPQELATPPPGQIQLLLVNVLGLTRDRLAQLLLTAPNDPTGKQSPLYPICQEWKTRLDQFVADRTHTSLFAMIPSMATILGRNQEDEAAAGFLPSVDGQIENCGPVLLRGIADHVTQQLGTVSDANLENIVKVFATPSFYSEAAFERDVMPIDAAGIMILNAATVVVRLKTGPWQQARRFMDGSSNTSAMFFARYDPNGDGAQVLKGKYLQDRVDILASFEELKVWVTQQEAAAGGE